MPLESGTTIGELNAAWPLGSDPKSQGDDHIRLIKDVMQQDVISLASTDPVTIKAQGVTLEKSDAQMLVFDNTGFGGVSPVIGANTLGKINVDIEGTSAYLFDPAGSSASDARTVMSREKGDNRYVFRNGATDSGSSFQLKLDPDVDRYFIRVRDRLDGTNSSTNKGIAWQAPDDGDRNTAIFRFNTLNNDFEWFLSNGSTLGSASMRLNRTTGGNVALSVVGTGGSQGLPAFAVESGSFVHGIYEASDDLWVSRQNLACYQFTGNDTALEGTRTVVSRQKGDARYTQTSSEVFKNNITAAPNLLGIIDQLAPKSFTWGKEIPETDERYGKDAIGLIAEEVQTVFPEAVRYQHIVEQGDGAETVVGERIHGLDPMALIAVLIEEVKDLRAKANAHAPSVAMVSLIDKLLTAGAISNTDAEDVEALMAVEP